MTHHKRTQVMQEIVQSYYREIKEKKWQNKGERIEESPLKEQIEIDKEKEEVQEPPQQKTATQRRKLIAGQRKKIKNITLLSEQKDQKGTACD